MRHAISFLALAAVVACDSTPFEPTRAPAAAVAHGKAGGMVTVPFEMHGTLEWIVDQSPAALALCAPRPGIAVGSGQGEATLLGHFEVVKAEHCSIDLAAPTPLVDGHGEWEWAGADGSSLYGTYVFVFAPPELGGFYTAYIEGGTGRLRGASGRFDFDPQVISCVDALCLNGATFETLAHGFVTLPRPRP
jgi:hypothetical protein